VWVCVCVGFGMCGCVYVWVLECVGVCVCVGFVMCRCSDNSVGVLVICYLYLLCFVLFVLCFYIVSFVYIYSYLLLV